MKYRLHRRTGYLFALLSLLATFQPAAASTYTLPSPGENFVGNVRTVSAAFGDSLGNIAAQNDIGFDQIIDANPTLDPGARLSSGTYVQVPSGHLLPTMPHKGIVINLAEMRLYYYPKGSDVVMTFPIGIGRVGKTIPITNTSVLRKVKDPIWIPPEDIRAFNQTQGITLPRIMKAGPDNPLGPYAIYLGLPTYLIHSTIFPDSVGKRASFGCIRMHEQDIKDFYPLVRPGTPVTIINLPTKAGWVNDKVYLEAHTPLEEHSNAYNATFNGIVSSVENAAHTRKRQITMVDWQLVADLADIRDGVPHEVGFVARKL